MGRAAFTLGAACGGTGQFPPYKLHLFSQSLMRRIVSLTLHQMASESNDLFVPQHVP